ncbi:hypothetical protein PY650_22165 [Rhizobium calliandrae]|uniref:Uncharacterized protein n=1 Tax=Rhizobium calliandrae TaxID=1312182 RepID=A0ABT7KJG3_9HYPH|nr:hypothetical protein [Rhizobium calliandrae]MDL2408302.1 hypothetical protein [Rhizobium calliandrae]
MRLSTGDDQDGSRHEFDVDDEPDDGRHDESDNEWYDADDELHYGRHAMMQMMTGKMTCKMTPKDMVCQRMPMEGMDKNMFIECRKRA